MEKWEKYHTPQTGFYWKVFNGDKLCAKISVKGLFLVHVSERSLVQRSFSP